MNCKHRSDQCCNACTDRRTTDGRGFPHPSEWRNRQPVRACPLCFDFVGPEHWVNDISHVIFCCSACAPGAYVRRANNIRAQLGTAAAGRHRKMLQRELDLLERRMIAPTG